MTNNNIWNLEFWFFFLIWEIYIYIFFFLFVFLYKIQREAFCLFLILRAKMYLDSTAKQNYWIFLAYPPMQVSDTVVLISRMNSLKSQDCYKNEVAAFYSVSKDIQIWEWKLLRNKSKDIQTTMCPKTQGKQGNYPLATSCTKAPHCRLKQQSLCQQSDCFFFIFFLQLQDILNVKRKYPKEFFLHFSERLLEWKMIEQILFLKSSP